VLGVSWLDEAAFVGEHDALNAVAQSQLLEYVADVRLHGRLADVELGRDLGVRQSTRDESEDVELALA
jgi:hypothetical protein